MGKRSRKDVSIRKEVYDLIQVHCIELGISVPRLIKHLCISFLDKRNGERIDHRDIRF